MLAFTIGALLPMLMILLPQGIRVPATAVSVALALALTGFLSARFAGAVISRAIARNVVGGVLAMAVTYGIGYLVGGGVA
jgi:VIT1/CCC1 family predicted Fe2+/Mn2+ transporter